MCVCLFCLFVLFVVVFCVFFVGVCVFWGRGGGALIYRKHLPD